MYYLFILEKNPQKPQPMQAEMKTRKLLSKGAILGQLTRACGVGVVSTWSGSRGPRASSLPRPVKIVVQGLLVPTDAYILKVTRSWENRNNE